MGDSTLVNGLLTRLDAVTAQMGVAATEVWGIWLATSWIGFAQNAVALMVAWTLAYLAWRSYKKSEGFDDELSGYLCVACIMIGGFVSFVSALGLIENFPYLFEPRLYALDQLRELVGR